MSNAAKYAVGGILSVGGLFYGRMYFNVLSAESNVNSIDREVRKTTIVRENLQKEITLSKKSFAELEANCAVKLKEQESIRRRIDETTGLLSKLKKELLQTTNDFEKLQKRMKEATTHLERLQQTDATHEKSLEIALANKADAMEKVAIARKAMKMESMPIVGPLFFKSASK